MAKLIGITGPQGSGKSTLLQALTGRIDRVAVDDFKVSRSVQAEFGGSLSQNTGGSFDDILKFQNRILEVKRERDLQQAERTDVDAVLMDRTFIDILSYTQIWVKEYIYKNIGVDGKIRPVDEIIDGAKLQQMIDFAVGCVMGQFEYCGVIYVPFMPHIQWEDDAHRADISLIEDFDTYAGDFMVQYSDLLTTQYCTISEKTVEDRAVEASHFISKFLTK